MAQINVHTAFSLLTDDDGKLLSFTPGAHTVADDIAAHWYVKNFISDDVNAPKRSGRKPASTTSQAAPDESGDQADDQKDEGAGGNGVDDGAEPGAGA